MNQTIEQIQPKVFWDGINNYSDNDMTTTQADFEQSTVYGCIDSYQPAEIIDLFSMGVADGLREPISILDHLQRKDRPTPKRVIVNDISESLFNEAKTNLKNRGFVDQIGSDHIIYFPGKIEEINPEITKETKIRSAIIGVYNLKYLYDALKLYKQNAHIIGKSFHVYPVYLNNDEGRLVLEHGPSIKFNIDNLNMDIMCQIDGNVDKSKKLYAQCVYTTDKHFVSHYFDYGCLESLVRSIFTGYDVLIHQEGEDKRYIVVELKCTKPTGSGVTLLTTLNNVLGNIKTNFQIQSLEVLKKLID